MSDNMFVFMIVVVTLLIPLVLFPLSIMHDKDKDKITNLEQRIEKLEKIVTYIEMKDQS